MNFLRLLKYSLWLLLLLNWSSLQASDCDREALHTAYRQLYEKVDAHEPFYALKLADSLIQVLKDRGETHCPLYLWIRYEKGEALELFRDRNDEALSLYYELIKDAKAIEHWEIMAQTYISIARTHEMINRPEDCLRNLNQARELIEQYDLPAVFSRFAVRYSSYHRFFDSQDSAKVYAQQAIEYGRKYQVLRSELDGYLLMGLLITDLSESIKYLQVVTDILLELEDFDGAAHQKMNIARRYYHLENFVLAAAQLDTAFLYAQQISESFAGYYGVYQRIYDFRRQLFEQRGEIDSAYYYLLKSREAERQVNIEVNQQEISQQEMAFAIAREQEKLRYEKQRTTYLRWGLIIVGLLLAGFVLGLINNIRKKRFIAEQKDLIARKNQALEQSLNRQSLLLSEVHHRVKNNLQLVMSLLTLKGRKQPEAAVQFHFDDLSSKVQSIALIHEQLYSSGEFEKVHLQSYFSSLASHFQVLHHDEHPFSFKLQTSELLLNLETVLPLGIICAELLSNTLKYAALPDHKMTINLSIKQKDDQFELIYRDNGPGYPDGQLRHQANSMGGMLINSMVRQLQAQGVTYNDDGAVFTLSFREKQISNL